jgi:uncharacterized membrane protein
MNKMLGAVFNSETAAFEGLSALKELHKDGNITLYATAVIVKDASGNLTTKQAADEGPIGTALGALVGGMMGVLGGPVGLAAGAAAGSLTGLIFDLVKSGVDLQFLDDVSKALSPGKAAVLAHLDESWVAPVDTRIGKAGGTVFRRLRYEVVEDQLARETAASKAAMAELREELAQAKAEDKAAIQQQIDDAKKKLQVMEDQAKARIDQAKREADAKIAALQGQLKQASDKKKATIEKRSAEIKADLEIRSAKLREAGRLAREALAA